MLNLNHLRYFYVFAQNRSVTRAAEVLGISQPSLSQLLKKFETEVGSPLFVRHGRTFELSSKGKALYEESKGIFAIADSLTTRMRTIEPAREATFTIGVSNEIERPFIAEVIGQVLRARRSQNVKFSVISKGHSEITADFRSGDLDLVITNHMIGERKPTYEFVFPVYLISSKALTEHRHMNEMNLKTVFQTLEEDLIVPSEGMVLRRELNRFIEKLPYCPAVVFESNILACAVRAIREGVGCGFIPRPYVQQDLKRGALTAIGPQKGYWQHRVNAYAGKNSDAGTIKSITQVIQEYCS